MKPFDLGKLAIVYLRQSTPGQVRDHTIATAEQYRLREIPERLGFPPERIVVVDEDLGVSGQTIAGRTGMLRVLELLAQGRVACVVVRDIGRLTRDEFNADIGLIARECYRAGARIVTPEKVYDPADPSDQLLLGFQGLLAGWDRAQLVRRLDHHLKARQTRNKVNINGACPAGYEKTAAAKSSPDHGRLSITRDVEVRERIALILHKGLELGGVLVVVRWLQQHGLRVPVMRGPDLRATEGADGRRRVTTAGPRAITWVEARREHVTRILKNPTYAGAIINGREGRQRDHVTGRRRWFTRPYSECVVIRDAHEGYITWDEHCRLLAMIESNVRAKPPVRPGTALLGGIGLARCGVCGAAVAVFYPSRIRRVRGRVYQGSESVYLCGRRHPDGRKAPCQRPAGPPIDRAVEALVVFALGTLDIAGARAAMLDRARARQEADAMRGRRVEALERRARMLEDAIAEATSAEGRGRLVARFEAALAELRDARAELATAAPASPPALSPEVLARLNVLRDPVLAWARFAMVTRRAIVRALASRITVYPETRGYVVVADWLGGGRAAARVTTAQRQKLYPVPDDVLALFSPGAETAAEALADACNMGPYRGTPSRPARVRTFRACARGRP